MWKNKSVLVTGVTGFVGSALARRLVDQHARVTGLIRDEVALSNYHRLDLAEKINVVRGSLEDFPLLVRILNEHEIEIIYHVGAQAIVGTAIRSPLSTFKSNVEGTWNLLEACRIRGDTHAIVVASSDKAYGSHNTLPYREDFPLNPQYPYDTSKACADMIAQTYFKTYYLPIVITRFANIYGPGDLNFSRIIPDTIRSVIREKNPVLRSNGSPERDYLYIDDVVDLYLLLAEQISKTKGEVFNAGHGKPVRVLDLVEAILRIAGREDLKPEILAKGELRGEIDRQYLDGEKVKGLLGWVPKIQLQEGLRRTYEWYRSYFSTEGLRNHPHL